MLDNINKFANTASTALSDALNERQNLGASFADGVAEANDRVLDTVVDTNRRVVDIAVSTADRVSAQLPSDFSFAQQLPTPAEAGDRYLDFVERAVALNRELNERVVEMLRNGSVVQVGTKTTAAKTTAAKTATTKKVSAKKPATKKATTKKASAKKPATKNAAAKKPAAKTATAKRPAKSTVTS